MQCHRILSSLVSYKRLIIGLLFVLFVLFPVSFGDVTSFKTPSTTADAGDGSPTGSVENWLNPNNAQTDNSTTATQDTDVSSQQGTYILCTNYGFTTSDVPSDATVNGIEVVFKRKTESNSGSTTDNSVKIIKGGSVSGTEMGTGTAWSTTLREDTYGGASSLWGLSWSPSDIHSSTFGVALASKASGSINKLAELDVAKIRIYYTPAGGAVTPHNFKSLVGVGK